MARIVGQIRISRPPEEVFDTIADSRNEPAYNPAMIDAELLTPPPIGPGTRFRAHMGRSRRGMLVELTEFDRPHRLGSHTTSSVMTTRGALTFTADDDDTVMVWNWQVQARGWLRLMGPLIGPLGGRMERKIWTSLKRHLESDDSPNPSGRQTRPR